MLPWLQEATRSNPDHVARLNDCSRCLREVHRTSRQSLGCAWESPDPRVPVEPWQHGGYTGPAPTICPGYTTRLPEVSEAVEASFYLGKSSLALLVKDELADALRESIAVLESASADVTSWAMRQKDK